MITKTLVITLCLVLAVAWTVRGQDWQSAELVDEIRHDPESIWIPDRSSLRFKAPEARPVAKELYGSTLLEQSSTVSAGMDLSALKDLVTQQIRASLEPELRAEVEARIERERAEARLIETVAKRVATWGSNFRFRAEEDPKPATPAITPPTIQVSNQPVNLLCAGIECQNGGTCVEGKCTCASGYTGPRCEVKASCDPANCLNGGKCMNNVCVCAPGWKGATCAEVDPTNKCGGVSCLNGGDCMPATGACNCFGNFKGARCEIAPPPGEECLNVDCKNGAVCKGGFCMCVNGFTGKYCEIDPCPGITCLNGGKCSQGKCQCTDGFTGDRCQIDPCKGIRCKHGGTCKAGVCKCTPEWEGARCEISMKTPAPFDVKPVMIPAWEQCTCPNAPPANCSTLVNYTCPDNSTKANVTKMNETISLANVSPHYPCHSVPCQNGGVCKEGKCKCKGNYGGLLCEKDLCSSITCQNGGICEGGACVCPVGFKGTFCEQNACDGITCQNGGQCRLGMCECHPDFEGTYCERKSELGRRRDSMNRRVEKITQRLNTLNETMPRIKNITEVAYLSENIANAAHYMLANASNAMQRMHDALSNSYHKPPRRLKDREGKYRWHQWTPPGVRAHRIKQVELPSPENNTLSVKQRDLLRAEEVNHNATQDHKEFPETMKKLETMALAEHDAEAETEADAEAETETEVDTETEAQFDAEGESEGESTHAEEAEYPNRRDVELLEIEAQIEAELEAEDPAFDTAFF